MLKPIKLMACIWLALSIQHAPGQSRPVPIVELKTRGLLGAVQNGRWLPPSRLSPKQGETFEFVLVGARGVEEGGVTKARRGETEDVCQDFFRFEFELQQEHGVAIGTGSKWNPVPRPVKTLDANSKVYRTAVTEFLKKKNIARPVVRIKDIYRVDLDADGVDEIVLAATYYKKGLSASAGVGDYSFVLVRKAVGKTVTDHLLKGDFIARRVDFGAPNEYGISAIADLNGDGKMEIVLHGAYYEGESAAAFEIKNRRPVEIKEFEIGCGV